MQFGLAMLATLLATGLPLPWKVAAAVFGLAAVVLGVIALRAVWRAGARGALIPVLGTGLALSVLVLFGIVVVLLLWPVQAELERCQRDALTISASEQCQKDFDEAIENLQDSLRQGG
jgi:hypothetical protein